MGKSDAKLAYLKSLLSSHHSAIVYLCKMNKTKRINKTVTLADLQNFAISKDGKCLDKKYVGSQYLSKWQCENGHQWTCQFYKLVKSGRW